MPGKKLREKSRQFVVNLEEENSQNDNKSRFFYYIKSID